MKLLKVYLKEIKPVKRDIFILSFTSPYLAKNSKPGNFLHMKIKNTILRRPFSIHKIEGDLVHILFRIKGKGTNILSRYEKGDTLDIIGPLGNGFYINKSAKFHILLAGGMGVAPLVFLAQRLKERKNLKITENIVFLGARTKKEILCYDDFKKLGFNVHIATEDGSMGFKGNITDLVKDFLDENAAVQKTVNALYACGPKEMFISIQDIIRDYPNLRCQVSFEQFMGCGLGVCCACVIETKNGYKKICKDGPVFDLRKI